METYYLRIQIELEREFKSLNAAVKWAERHTLVDLINLGATQVGSLEICDDMGDTLAEV